MLADATCSVDSDDNFDTCISTVNTVINKIAACFKANKMTKTIETSKNNRNKLNVFYNANDPNVKPNPDLITTRTLPRQP
jgi:hypothetical protein